MWVSKIIIILLKIRKTECPRHFVVWCPKLSFAVDLVKMGVQNDHILAEIRLKRVSKSIIKFYRNRFQGVSEIVFCRNLVDMTAQNNNF